MQYIICTHQQCYLIFVKLNVALHGDFSLQYHMEEWTRCIIKTILAFFSPVKSKTKQLHILAFTTMLTSISNETPADDERYAGNKNVYFKKRQVCFDSGQSCSRPLLFMAWLRWQFPIFLIFPSRWILLGLLLLSIPSEKREDKLKLRGISSPFDMFQEVIKFYIQPK